MDEVTTLLIRVPETCKAKVERVKLEPISKLFWQDRDNYKLHRLGEDWRVYDLVIENVSLINNYRSQFNRILTSSTYDELVSRIKTKVSNKGDQVE